MTLTFGELACVVAIGILALQLPQREREVHPPVVPATAVSVTVATANALPALPAAVRGPVYAIARDRASP